MQPIEEMTQDLVRSLFPPREAGVNKGSFGTIALAGGSLRYSGAIRLSAMANCAMRCGAGVVKLASPRCLSGVILPEILESTYFPLSETEEGAVLFKEEEWQELTARCRVTAVGMGIGNSRQTQQVVSWLLENYTGILLLDADALNALAAQNCQGLDRAACPVVITPHPGEFSRLCGQPISEILENGEALAQQFAQQYGVTVLLKGPLRDLATIVTDGERTYRVDRGCPGMATAGSGDVLAGIIAAVLSQPTVQKTDSGLAAAAAAGAYIAGAAGELAQERANAVTMTAGDTAACVRDVMIQLLGRGNGSTADK
ncbi:MAG: NAD(P)H-hydrate dehydratase [Lachnospiraceae bacterium]|nr:NAD(P)H-hydrate dehydratase [Lachnospiraceae bacterium]